MSVVLNVFIFLVPIILVYVLAYEVLTFSKVLLTKRVLTDVLLTAGLRQMKPKVTNTLLLSSEKRSNRFSESCGLSGLLGQGSKAYGKSWICFGKTEKQRFTL